MHAFMKMIKVVNWHFGFELWPGVDSKKYLIEDLVEGKIVGRRKGFTASTWYGSSSFLSRNLL
jgi:hypothetical protein